MTQITAYEPKLEAPNLPAHLGIDEALKLEPTLWARLTA